MSINSVAISGNLTRDPELRSKDGETGTLRFSIAVNDRRRNPQTGDWEDVPNYVDCAIFGKRAVSVERYLAKGSKVSILGKLRQEKWQKDGKNFSRITVVCDEIEFMSQSQKQKQKPREEYGDYYSDDIPF